MFHELAHQLVYIEDDTMFNEAFAQMVEEEGWRRWLASKGTEAGRAQFLRYRARQVGFQGLLKQTREALQVCYGPEQKHAVRLECKQSTLALMQQRYVGLKKSWDGYSGYDTWFKAQPNNAHFVSSHTYRHYVPAFKTLLHRQGDDLQLFYAEVKRLAELSFQERRQIMEGLLEDEKPPL
jgi:predicted aminopeptidase